MEPIISIKHLVKSFGDKEVLKDINLDVYPGEVVSVIGSSGSGKSTMLRCINKLEEADSGEIYFNGVDILDAKTNINKLRENIGMVFQSFNLFNNKNVLDNCTLALTKIKKMPKEEAKKIAEKCEVNIPDLKLDKNYKGSLAGFLEFKKDLVLNLVEEYLNAEN